MVFGSGSTWPHDLRFLAAARDSELEGVGCEEDGIEDEAEGVEKFMERSSILMVAVGESTVGGGVSLEAETIADVVRVWAKSEDKLS